MKLVENDHRVFAAEKVPDRRARLYDRRHRAGELVEREDSFFRGAALEFRRPVAIELSALDAFLVGIGDPRLQSVQQATMRAERL